MCQIQRAIKCFVSISLKSSPRKKWLREIERVIYQTLLPIIQTTVSINEQHNFENYSSLHDELNQMYQFQDPTKKLNNLWAFLDILTFRRDKIRNIIKTMRILYEILYLIRSNYYKASFSMLVYTFSLLKSMHFNFSTRVEGLT